ncbi:MAG: hypothetical protein KDH17_14920 [Rhodocyclaceae bacterium]|nr:hypothetical protein [Rhodocyclaceae bacterium]MCP5233766.1 hypothetical protein [Zoogloeaceae bacterium]
MRSHLLAVLAAALLGAAPGMALAGGQGPIAASDENCGCVSGAMDSDADVRRCGPLLNSLSPAQVVDLKGRCSAKSAPAGGPDLCFCLTQFHTDPQIVKACEAVVGKNTKPSELARMGANCR